MAVTSISEQTAIFFYDKIEIAIKKSLHLQSEKIGKISNKK